MLHLLDIFLLPRVVDFEVTEHKLETQVHSFIPKTRNVKDQKGELTIKVSSAKAEYSQKKDNIIHKFSII